MKERLLTAGEKMTIRANLYEIEKKLNRPIPRGLVNPVDLKDRLLTHGELMTMCANIDSIEKNHHRNHVPGLMLSNLEMIIGYAVLGIGLIYYLIS